MTIVESYKAHEQRTRKSLLQLLRYSEEDIAILIFEGAYEYLDKVFGTDEFGMSCIPKTSQFWDFWKKEWNHIDSMFVANVVEYSNYKLMWTVRARDNDEIKLLCRTVEELREQYLYWHEASMSNRFINRDVVKSAAHHMIRNIIEQQKKEVSHG